MKRYENVDKALCHEMEKLDKKYAGDVEMSMQDLEMIRLIYSSLVKSQTYHAMQEEEELSGRSYARRGRDAMGRYISRDMDGYSGHYPDYMPPYYGQRY